MLHCRLPFVLEIAYSNGGGLVQDQGKGAWGGHLCNVEIKKQSANLTSHNPFLVDSVMVTVQNMFSLVVSVFLSSPKQANYNTFLT